MPARACMHTHTQVITVLCCLANWPDAGFDSTFFFFWRVEEEPCTLWKAANAEMSSKARSFDQSCGGRLGCHMHLAEARGALGALTSSMEVSDRAGAAWLCKGARTAVSASENVPVEQNP